MVPWRLSLHVAAVLMAALLSFPALAQSPTPGCEPWAARLVSYQGTLSTRRASGVQPAGVSLNDTFCVGDVLEIGPFSRAAIQLPDQTVVRLDQGTIVTFAAPQDDKRTWLDILKGAIHVISRDPRALRVITPFANAGIEGTEFYVQVGADAATVLVFEGRVKVENAIGAATASSGESVLAKAGSAPVLQQVVRPRDQVVWTLYYPPTGASADPLVARAEQQLAVGRVAEAEADLASALRQSPGSAEVLARQSVIALTRNDTATAATLADQAVAAAPASVAARLAQSYVRQSAGDLPAAVATLEDAEPGNALVRARLAELYLASGDVRRSEAAAGEAIAADPTLGLARSILGFARLTRVDLPGARAAFDEAIRLEPYAPLPRLGLGLAKIRDGDLEAGRAEIETAVILDPNNSIVRSYMGKAYYEEKRDGLAASQLAIAKELDPNDPTPWFYDAIRKQTINEPVAALKDLQQSTRLNDNRSVYRSGLLLDDDAASRNASVSALYSELGFESLAVVEGTKALAGNFGNSSAHRLLANAYSDIPRYDISRVSEAFQAQVRQPLSAPPVNLLEAADRLTVLRDTGPSRVGINEYNSLFNRDQLRIQADIVAGSRDTWGDQFVASGLTDRLGFAFSQLHYETAGFTDNNVGEKDIYGAFFQYEATPTDTLQLDARHSEFLLGYTFSAFDPDLIFPVEIDEEADVLRLNGRHVTSPDADWVWTAAYEDRTRDAIFAPLDILATT
ncbi:MAG: FecR domain-containing protein, partial [Gammaproteobacteria bacterium]|nr:FecR domain-containing protein [Gammaproteobacteria bacterium]